MPPQPALCNRALDELAGKSAREIARILNERNVSTPTGKPWSAMTVIRAQERLAA
jgi:Recombinase